MLTWDPRGFGHSTGRAEVDSPAFEAKDVSALISWVATRPGVQLDRTGDPRMGMVGGSYGGGIQFVTAATDCRVDAIVPTIAWHSLTTSLNKAGTAKSGWSAILTHLAGSDHVDPETTAAYQSGVVDGTTTPSQLAWFAARGPAQLLHQVHIPTLIVQGTVDTLFTLQEGVDNYEALKANGVTTSMRWFCGGHGVCLTPTGDPTATEQATLAWLKRYVQRDTSVDTGPGFSFVDQNGTAYSAPTYPLPEAPPFTGTGSGTLALVATGGSGPISSVPGDQQLGGLVAPITPAPATNAVNVPVPFARAGVIVGAPRLVLTYSGSAAPGTRPTRVFAQLVDRKTGLVLGNQVTPVPVTLDGRRHTTTVPLEIVAFTAEPSSDVELQLVATTRDLRAAAARRLGGVLVRPRDPAGGLVAHSGGRASGWHRALARRPAADPTGRWGRARQAGRPARNATTASLTAPGWVMLAAWVPPSTATTPRHPTRPAARASALSIEIDTSAVPWTTSAGTVISPSRSAMLSRSSRVCPGLRSDSWGRALQVAVQVADSAGSPMIREALASASSSEGPLATHSSTMPW